MTEKRADYRKNQRRKKLEKLLHRQSQSPIKSSKKNLDEDGVDVNPDFKRDNVASDTIQSDSLTSEEKVNRLKKRLNWAILIVIILIVIVLLALFKL